MAESILIAGAGITGIACARTLRERGVDFTVINRGRKIGGRMASKAVRDSGTAFEGRVFDVGASYFTVSDPGFQTVVNEMKERGVVFEWTDTFHVADSSGIVGVKIGPMRYRAPLGIRSVVEYLAEGIDVTEGEVSETDLTNRTVALCMPTPQAAKIYPAAMELNPVTWEPIIAVSLLFDSQHWAHFDGVFINGDYELIWIANDGARRGDNAPALVAHVHPVLSSHHLTDPASVIPFAISAVQRILGFGADPIWASAHRWTYAKPVEGTTTDQPHFHLDRISLAGDAFASRPRVEAGWISGSALGNALAGT